MRIYINASHTPHSPGAVYGGRKEHYDVLSFAESLKEKLKDRGLDCCLFAGYLKPSDIKVEDAVLIFHRGTAYKNEISSGASVTVNSEAGTAVQYEAYLLLEALCQSGGYRYRGVHTASRSFPHRFIEKTGTPRTFLFDVGYIESAEDNRLFDENKEKTASATAKRLAEIYMEGKYENNS